MNMVMRTMDQMNVDLGILSETKLDHEMYLHDCCGYTVVATTAKSSHQGGVAVFYRSHSAQWSVEGIQTHGPNMMSFSLMSGRKIWTIIRCYISPSKETGETIEYIDKAVHT